MASCGVELDGTGRAFRCINHLDGKRHCGKLYCRVCQDNNFLSSRERWKIWYQDLEEVHLFEAARAEEIRMRSKYEDAKVKTTHEEQMCLKYKVAFLECAVFAAMEAQVWDLRKLRASPNWFIRDDNGVCCFNLFSSDTGL